MKFNTKATETRFPKYLTQCYRNQTKKGNSILKEIGDCDFLSMLRDKSIINDQRLQDRKIEGHNFFKIKKLLN
jgi:hypothetical protein